MPRDKIFFWDLDGPILNVMERYYGLYKDLITEAGYEALDRQEYWDAKRSKVPEIEILGRTGATEFHAAYQKARFSLIEDAYYLSFDSLQEGAREALKHFSAMFQLVLVTLRRSSSQLNNEIERLDIKKHFSKILTSREKLHPRWRIKHNLLKAYLGDNNGSKCLIIGDTETDITAGNKLGFNTIGVLNGIRSRGLIIEAKPCLTVDSVKDLLKPEWLDCMGGEH